MIKHTSNNIIIYRGRYIRRFLLSRNYPPCYLVSWTSRAGRAESFYGSLPELIEKIDDTIRFFGKWEFLI